MKKANTAKSKKAKGKALENWLASELRRTGADDKARAMPGSGSFTHFKSDIYTKLPYSFECKSQETTKVWEWYVQAQSQAGNMEAPVVVFKRNYSQPMALLSASDFINMVAEIEDLKRILDNRT